MIVIMIMVNIFMIMMIMIIIFMIMIVMIMINICIITFMIMIIIVFIIMIVNNNYVPKILIISCWQGCLIIISIIKAHYYNYIIMKTFIINISLKTLISRVSHMVHFPSEIPKRVHYLPAGALFSPSH